MEFMNKHFRLGEVLIILLLSLLVYEIGKTNEHLKKIKIEVQYNSLSAEILDRVTEINKLLRR